MGAPRPSIRPGRLSAVAYFTGVALATALGVGVVMMLRPSFGHSVKALIGLERTIVAAPGSFYAVRVAPVFEAHCTGCHGANRQKADLRLDSISALRRGGKRGSVVMPGDPKRSELLLRMMLPSTDAKAMPPEGKAPVAAEEITIVRLWIQTGASPVLPVSAIQGAPPPPRRIDFPQIDPSAVVKARAPIAPIVEKLQKQYPDVVAYESRGSAALEINASRLGRSFDDGKLKAFAPLVPHLVRADLSGTAITDASAALIAQMTRLQVLHLQGTHVTDRTIEAIAPLSKLRVLTVFDTGVTKSAVQAMRRPGLSIYAEDANVWR